MQVSLDKEGQQYVFVATKFKCAKHNTCLFEVKSITGLSVDLEF